MRETLLDAVEAVREVLVAGAAEEKEIGTLLETSLDALEQSGLLAMKPPADLGEPRRTRSLSYRSLRQ